MNRKVYPEGGVGEVFIPSSKSDVHRILIAAALSQEATEVEIHGLSDDIEATMECLRRMGSKIYQLESELWKVEPVCRGKSVDQILDCKESGSTLRFILPVAAALNDGFRISGEGRLPQRPITELISQMEHHGCNFDSPVLPFTVTGILRSGQYYLPGNVSSQYITGLLLALPLLSGDSEIRLETALESGGYVEMTLATLARFKIQVERRSYGYFIPGGQTYQSPGRIMAEGDWSGAAFFLAAGALKGPVICRGLNIDTRQGDYQILDLLRRFGADIRIHGNDIVVRYQTLKGIDIDASEIPDLVPILSVVAAKAKGETRIYNAGRLRIKESDRLAAMCEGLTRIGTDVEEQAEEMRIKGLNEGHGRVASISGYGDHRIVMAMTVAALAAETALVIEDSEAANKSYPDFFKDWVQIGGRADVI